MNSRTERPNLELLLRYGCATLVTWIAAAGAQLMVRNEFVFAILFISLLGIPVSLYLRLHSMRVAGFALSRPLWNAFTVMVFFVSAGAWTVLSMSDLLSLVMNGGASPNFWMHFGAQGLLTLLMQIFLLFAAFRSFALISDKDATLATVPSFSVLLLLIPVHRGIEVVFYFLAWTLAAATLFALDHRAELLAGTDGRVPAALPGQGPRLAARGLATVLATALVAAFSLSALLTSRSPDDQSATESAITSLASRLAQFAAGSPESSYDGGPERQIDFSSGPALPSRALLWKVRVQDIQNNPRQPDYFRLFTLSRFNGSAWTQGQRDDKPVPLSPLPDDDSPFMLGRRARQAEQERDIGSGRTRLDGGRLFENDADSPAMQPLPQEFPPRSNGPDPIQGMRRPHQLFEAPFGMLENGQEAFGLSRRGFAVRRSRPELAHAFGQPTAPLIVRVQSNVATIGFLPLLPGTRTVILASARNRDIKDIRSGGDGSVDVGTVQENQITTVLSDVPTLADYGSNASQVPRGKVAARADSPRLTSGERARYLELPVLSARTRRFARTALAKAPPSENSYARARRLALAIDNGATYTLRPPTPPTGHEATDFFLFDGNRRGYCTHFASALAVLCRAQGIPARVVSGFAAQEYAPNGWAQLRNANAHAWTEVWVEQWGWALVDATPAADRGDNAPNLFAYWADWIGFAWNQVQMWSRSRLPLLGLMAGVLLLGVHGFRRRALVSRWWAGRSGNSSEERTRREVVAAYDGAALRLAHLFRARAPFETPDEWLAAARPALDAPRARPFARQEFELLTGHYLRALYAPRAPDDSVVASARELARQVQRRKRYGSRGWRV